VESACLHCGNGFRIPHEGIPHESRAEIFRHQQSDSKIDANNIGIVPMKFRVKGIAESIPTPRVFSEIRTKSTQDLNAVARKKR
jgi:hypothetical protein